MQRDGTVWTWQRSAIALAVLIATPLTAQDGVQDAEGALGACIAAAEAKDEREAKVYA